MRPAFVDACMTLNYSGSCTHRSFIERAEAAAAALVFADSGPEILAAEVGPEDVLEHELGVRGLPQQVVRDAVFAGRADHEVRVGHVGCVQMTRHGALIDLVGRDASVTRLRGDRAYRV